MQYCQNNETQAPLEIFSVCASYLTDSVYVFLTWNMGRGKVAGRKSMLESNPELIQHVRELKSGDYTKQEVTAILFKMSYKTSKGNPFHQAQITEFYRQNQGLNWV